MNRSKPIIIFGSGYHGRMAYRKIREKNKKIQIIFIDNKIKKRIGKIFDQKILNPFALKKINYSKIILCGRNIIEQKKQLNKLNINKNILYWGRKKLKPNKKILSERLKKYLKLIKYIKKIFDKNKISYWVDKSGLLAIQRKNNISEMSDFDISINAHDCSNIIKLLKKGKRYKVIIKWIYYSKFLKKKFPQIIIFGNTNFNKIEPPIIDFIPRVIYDCKSEELKTKKNIFWKKNFWSDNDEVKYKNLVLKVPFEREKYLEILYGKNWKIEQDFWLKK